MQIVVWKSVIFWVILVFGTIGAEEVIENKQNIPGRDSQMFKNNPGRNLHVYEI